MEVHQLCAFFAEGDVRQQIDLAVLQHLQTLLPGAGNCLQMPALLVGNGLQQFTENARWLCVGIGKDLWLVGVYTDPDRACLCGNVPSAAQQAQAQQQVNEAG